MKLIITTFILLANLAHAHCPIELNVNGQNFCTEIQWLNGDQMVKGQFTPTSQLSPQLVLGSMKNSLNNPTIYSRARLLIWFKGDPSHHPQLIENLSIFPFMRMNNGHHHPASYDFRWIKEVNSYEISGVAFIEMPGCWSFRWTTGNPDVLDGSKHLIDIVNFQNLTPDQNRSIAANCAMLSSPEN